MPLFAHWEEAENPERNLPAEFTFRLDSGTTIGGTVRDPDGKPIKGVSVEVMLSRGPEGDGEGRTSPDMWLAEHEAAARTDAEGRWTLDNVPPGLDLDLKLRLTHPDYVSDTGVGHLARPAGRRASRTCGPARRRSRCAAGWSRPARSPIPPASRSRARSSSGATTLTWEWGSQEVRTDEQGRYTFPPLPSGPLNVTVIAPGWMPAIRKVEIKPGMRSVRLPARAGQGAEAPLRGHRREAGPGRRRADRQVARRRIALQPPAPERPGHEDPGPGR